MMTGEKERELDLPKTQFSSKPIKVGLITEHKPKLAYPPTMTDHAICIIPIERLCTCKLVKMATVMHEFLSLNCKIYKFSYK